MTAESGTPDELAYALVTPYSLRKSRTGGILARLLWANVRLAAARMYAPVPGGRFVGDYCDAIYDPEEKRIPLRYQKMLIEYVAENFSRPNPRGISNRSLLLVFRGPNAQREIQNAIGHMREEVRGDDVRGTFGDLVAEDWSGAALRGAQQRAKKALARYPALQKIEVPERRSFFFEPAVLTGVTPEMTEAHLKLFRACAYSDGGFVLSALEGLDTSGFETSMMILKPENFLSRNPLPGNLLDFFSRTGMYITGAKVMRMSVQQAQDFYALKLPQFREQLKGMVARAARDIVEKARSLADAVGKEVGADAAAVRAPARIIPLVRKAERLFGARERQPGQLKPEVLAELYRALAERLQSLEPDEAFYAQLAEELKDLNAQAEFNELIRYMSGTDPVTGRCADGAGETVCMAILYSGKDGLKVIRHRLRELRAVYGQNILQNRAHASDPAENPVREVEVLGMPNAPAGEGRPCDVEAVVNEFYGPA